MIAIGNRMFRTHFWLALLLVVAQVASVQAVTPEVTHSGDRLSLKANGASIKDTLTAICRALGCTLSVRGTLDETSTLELQGVLVRDGIKRLLESGGHSLVLVYAGEASGQGGGDRIEKVIALARGSGGASSVVVQSPDAATSSAGMSRGRIERELRQAQARRDEEGARFLTEILLTSEDVALRERAASAIVGLGDLVDEGALLAALGDDAVNVRRQVIRALAGTEGEDAGRALLEIAAEDEDLVSRRIAVNELWRFDSPGVEKLLRDTMQRGEGTLRAAARQSLANLEKARGR